MKRSRIKGIDGNNAIYHCISRVVGGDYLWGESEKEMMRKQLWRVADFSGVRVITYCLMSNHFHILVSVPDAGKSPVLDAELLRRYRRLYPRPTRYERLRIDALEKMLRENGSRAKAIRARLLARMHDVSQFMKTFKQRFSLWYNRTHNRHGTHWSERFKSVLVENDPRIVRTIAAYIDLNPVRAGLVHDPKDYRWCGYAEAVAGGAKALEGLDFLRYLKSPTRDESATSSQSSDRGSKNHPTNAPISDLRNVLADYRVLLFGRGASIASSKDQAATIPIKQVQDTIREGGALSQATLLSCRLRYFTAGLILGSKNFVRTHLEERLRRGEIKRHPKPPIIQMPDGPEIAAGKSCHGI